MLVASGVAGCALAPRSPGPAQRTRSSRFLDATLACDDGGHVYVAAAEEMQGETQISCVASNRYGESWDPRIHHLNGSLSGERRRPRLATGAPGEVYAVWEDTRQGPRDLYFNRSIDGGATWLPLDLRVNTNPPGGSHLTAPSIACDERGNVYVVWLDDREGFEAFYANRSRDRGQSWLPADVRVTSLALGRKSAPRLVCDESGNVYVGWVERRAADQSIYCNSSSDRGETWLTADVQVSHSNRRAYAPDLCALESQVLAIAWLEEGSQSADVYYSLSTDRGRRWDIDARPFTTRASLFNPTSPRVSCDGQSHVYVAWHLVTAEGDSRILLESSQDSGRSFRELLLEPTHAVGGADLLGISRPVAEAFRMACDRNGNTYLAWVERGAAGAAIGFDRVSDYGRNWLRLGSAPEDPGHPPVSAEPPALCADNSGHVYLMWNDGDGPHVAASPFYGDSGWRFLDL